MTLKRYRVLNLFSDFGPVQKTCTFVIQYSTSLKNNYFFIGFTYTQLHCNLLSVPQPNRYDTQGI